MVTPRREIDEVARPIADFYVKITDAVRIETVFVWSFSKKGDKKQRLFGADLPLTDSW
jgi:hypothetical protein